MWLAVSDEERVNMDLGNASNDEELNNDEYSVRNSKRGR